MSSYQHLPLPPPYQPRGRLQHNSASIHPDQLLGPPPPAAPYSVVADYDLIARKILPPVNDNDVLQQAASHWYVSDFLNAPDKLYGPKVCVGGSNWQLVLYPRGKDGFSDDVSVTLQWATGESASSYEYVDAQFVICMSTMSFPTNYTSRSGSFRFTRATYEYSFPEYAKFAYLTSNDFETGRDAFIKNDRTRLTVIIRVVRTRDGFDSGIYDSRANTGFVGFERIGNTSYMEVVLQLLFAIKKFRKAVYSVPTNAIGDITSENNTILALQRLFLQMEFAKDSASIFELLQSFGWDEEDASNSEDCVDFLLAFLRSIDSTCINNEANPLSETKRLFGNVVAHAGEDYFMESMISLSTTGCKSLQECLTKATKKDWTFRKRLSMKILAPVLLLDLRIWRQNLETYAIEKSEHHVSYPLHLNMGPYTSDPSKSIPYTLFGVIMHNGSVEDGQNCVYINTSATGRPQWCKFDGSRAQNVRLGEVLEPHKSFISNGARFNENMPYVLCYIRATQLQDVLCDIKAENIPDHVH